MNDINEVINNTEKYKNEEIKNKIANSNKIIIQDYEENEMDTFLTEAIDVVIETGQASISFIQRRVEK